MPSGFGLYAEQLWRVHSIKNLYCSAEGACGMTMVVGVVVVNFSSGVLNYV